MREAKDLRFGVLGDFYGCLLTQKQYEAIKMYYDWDFSLQEIAEQTNVTPQAVLFCLKNAQALLQEYESKLKLGQLYDSFLQELAHEDVSKTQLLALVEQLKSSKE